jgi:hypothetical protein
MIAGLAELRLPDQAPLMKFVKARENVDSGRLMNVYILMPFSGSRTGAASFGAISDVIADEEKGFLLTSTALERLAQRIAISLNYKDLERIADNAEGLIRQKFTRTAATERYGKILKEVLLDVRRPTG